MTESTVLERLEELSRTVAELRQRVEDLDDLRGLENAIGENGDKPLVPWKEAKARLGLDEDSK